MPDRFLQRPFANIVVQRRSRHTQEQRQLLPMPKQVRHGLAQPGVRLDAALVKLSNKPGMKTFHDRPAPELMKEQSLFA